MNGLLTLIQQLLIWGHLILVVAMAVRVIMRRLPVGATLAWILVLMVFPYFGVALYLLFGERFLGVKRAQREARLRFVFRDAPVSPPSAVAIDWSDYHASAEPLSRLEAFISGIPPVAGNNVEFLQSAPHIIDSLAADIKSAESFCHMEFYIWQPGGETDKVVAAIEQAAARGVVFRIMLDAVGSSAFFGSEAHKRLKDIGASVVKACPIGIIPWQLARYDLRNHRKTVIIDQRVAYMGSFNLVDPKLFKVDAGVGEWIDVMARVSGPAVPQFDAVFRWYWSIERSEPLLKMSGQPVVVVGEALVQVAPSGPDVAKESILNALLQAIYGAKYSVDIVTPYFVPGEALEHALKIAARRGVQVRLLVPEKVDSFLVRHASHSYFSSLMEAGVSIATYGKGLLHTKAVVVDNSLAFFGTVNMDLRSLWLNFEMTMIIYDVATVRSLAEIIESYRHDSEVVELAQWRQRRAVSRFFENITHLVSPLI
ncbi:cardiolipin synthase [Gilvimarinus sp. SDUM040013]|uniref:Cardiolipin synthase n=1 Tax=Gilvimarinus gilvus TaxID=3058038 RepID=A0ABU4S5R7_9GAMM|nr:cardiolipin synthase [Gilvimarinus sp. SDUM040013]MDO3384901.1 cardiolipin synthase [Gilvimarinus sp. SDUM040013]MDX6850674.1 cardiolipin synthase [Gilvimarinus sp. SDUM040013]